MDAGGADIEFLDDGTSFLKISNSSSDVHIRSIVQDKDILLRGNDGGSQITALTLDMSEAGDATFNSNIFLGDSKKANFGAGNDLQIYHDSSDSFIDDAGTGDLKIRSSFTRIIDISNDNVAATFASGGVNLRHSNAVKFTTTSAGATVTGALTADGGLKADNITIDGTEIDLSSGDLTLDVAGDIILNADGGDWIFRDGGTEILKIFNASSDVSIKAQVQDKDLKFLGNDGGSGITALTLDMSEAGAATFNDKIILGANKAIEFGDAGESISGDGTDMTITGNIVKIDADSRIILDAAENRIDLHDNGTEFARFVNNAGQLQIRTGSSSAAAISFDSSGGATFNDKVILGANKVIEFGDSGETISGDGTAITVASSEDITLDAASEINLDAGSDSIRIKDDGTEYGRIHRVSGGGLIIKSQESDKDIQFQGVDGGSGITPMMIDMSEGGRVGIFGSGTTVPTAQLHVATDAGGVKLQVTGSSSSVTPGNDADEIFVDNAGNAGVTIGSGTSSKGSIHFGDSGDNDIGMIEYDHSSNL